MIFIRLILLTALLLLCGQWSTVDAKEIFVNNVRGDDRFDGLSERNVGGEQGPVRTIDRALRLARLGDRVIIANTGEPYRESIALYGNQNSGYADLPFLLEGNGAVLDGTVPVDHRLWKHVRGNLFRFRPLNISHQQLYSDGFPLTKVSIDPARSIIPQLKPGQWCTLGDHIYLVVDENKLPIDYELSYTGHQVGITIYSARHVIVTDLIVQGYRLDGINVHDLCSNVLLSGVTARGNARSGVTVAGASRATLSGSVIGDNGVAQLRTEEQARLEVVETQIIDNTAPKWQVTGGTLFINGQQVKSDLNP